MLSQSKYVYTPSLSLSVFRVFPPFASHQTPGRQRTFQRNSRSLINLIHFIFYGSFFEVARAMLALYGRVRHCVFCFCINLARAKTRRPRAYESRVRKEKIRGGRRTWSRCVRPLPRTRVTEVSNDTHRENWRFSDDDYNVASNIAVVTAVWSATTIIIVTSAQRNLEG